MPSPNLADILSKISDGLCVLDITSRHRLEEALRASEERFRRLTDSNIIGVLVVESG